MSNDAPTHQLICRQTAAGLWSVTISGPGGRVSVEADSKQEAIECAMVASFLIAPGNEAV